MDIAWLVGAIPITIGAVASLHQLFTHGNKERGKITAAKHVARDTWALEISWIGPGSAWDITANGERLADRIDASSDPVCVRRLDRNTPVIVTWRTSNHWWNRRHKTTFSAVSDIPKAPPIIITRTGGMSPLF